MAMVSDVALLCVLYQRGKFVFVRGRLNYSGRRIYDFSLMKRDIWIDNREYVGRLLPMTSEFCHRNVSILTSRGVYDLPIRIVVRSV